MQIRKLSDLFRYRKSTNFPASPLNSKFANFYKIMHNSILKTNSPKKRFFYVQILIKSLYATFVREKTCICGLSEVVNSQKSLGLQIANPQITNPQFTKKDWVHKSQTRKVPHLQKVRKYNKLVK